MTSPAPAAVPSEEEIARVVDADSWRHLDEARSTVVEPFIEAMERCVEPSLVTARAVLALFDAAIRERDGWVTHWQTKCQATRALELAAEARALAAEAALAAARAEYQSLRAVYDASLEVWGQHAAAIRAQGE